MKIVKNKDGVKNLLWDNLYIKKEKKKNTKWELMSANDVPLTFFSKIWIFFLTFWQKENFKIILLFQGKTIRSRDSHRKKFAEVCIKALKFTLKLGILWAFFIFTFEYFLLFNWNSWIFLMESTYQIFLGMSGHLKPIATANSPYFVSHFEIFKACPTSRNCLHIRVPNAEGRFFLPRINISSFLSLKKKLVPLILNPLNK